MFKIEAAPTLLTGRSDPTPALTLSLRVGHQARPKAPQYAFHSCFPRIRLGTGSEWFSVEAHVAHVTPPDIGGNQHFAIDLRVPTPAELLERVESARLRAKNGSVVIEGELNLSVCQVVEGDPATFLSPPDLLLPGVSISALRFEISRDEWRAVLEKLGFAEILVFEFPRRLPGGPSGPVANALGILRSAHGALAAGEYDSVAARCYRALEAIAPGSGGVPSRLMDQHFSGLNQVLSERLSRMLIGAMPLYHVGRHAAQDPQGVPVEVSRAHAMFLLGMTELILGWCAAAAP